MKIWKVVMGASSLFVEALDYHSAAQKALHVAQKRHYIHTVSDITEVSVYVKEFIKDGKS